MGCGDACPWLPVRHRIDWDIPDPKDLDDDGFRRVRDLVEARVKDLLEQVGRR
jgi:arsenate reductase